jgi:DNA modification methylase
VSIRIIQGDYRNMLKTLPSESMHCCVTSPPYFGLRDYGVAGQIGLEPTPDAFVAEMVAVFREVRRVLRDDGTLWLNLGDSYAGHNPTGFRPGNEVKNGGASNKNGVGFVAGLKPKDLIGIPWRVAFALQADGWYLRSDIIWHKPNPMPESVTDRPTKSHEYLFLLSKSERYFFDAEAIAEPSDTAGETRITVDHGGGGYQAAAMGRQPSGNQIPGKVVVRGQTRNKRSVWTVATQPFSEAHFATFPPALIEPCIKAGCPTGGTVLDPFGGAGTTGMVADRLGRNAVLIELNPAYAAMASNRIKADAGMFANVDAAE